MIKKQTIEEYKINPLTESMNQHSSEPKNKKKQFELFKAHQGHELVQMIKEKVELIKTLRAELNLCISTCNELKSKIDAKLKKIIPNEKRDSKAGTEEDYKLQMDIRRFKIEHEEFLDEYKKYYLRLKSYLRV